MSTIDLIAAAVTRYTADPGMHFDAAAAHLARTTGAAPDTAADALRAVLAAVSDLNMDTAPQGVEEGLEGVEEPRVTLAHDPAHRLPWTVLIEGSPAYRVADAEHAARALELVPQIMAEGWEPAAAVLRAVEDAATMTTDLWEPVG